MKKHTRQLSPKASGVRAESTSNVAAVKVHDVIKLGVDTHGQQYTFARMIDQGGVQPAQKMAPGAFIDFLAKQLTLAKRVVMVYEAGPYGFALYREATALGIECLVCAPERLSRGRKRVNDKIDATELLSRLDRQLAGNKKSLRLVHVPTLEQELSRRKVRERNTYRKDRQRWIYRGRSLLHTLGISRPGKWFRGDIHQGHSQTIEKRYGKEVARQIGEELDGYLEVINQLETKLDELTAQLKKEGVAKATVRIRGIGPLSQEMLDREMGDWNRFSNRRQVASYTGLCPGEDSSGDSQMSLSIDKHGNPRVRALLVELAWLMTKFQPNYRRLQRWKWVFDQPTAKGMRKKAAVALARQLAVDLWRIRTGRASPQDLGLQLAA